MVKTTITSKSIGPPGKPVFLTRQEWLVEVQRSNGARTAAVATAIGLFDTDLALWLLPVLEVMPTAAALVQHLRDFLRYHGIRDGVRSLSLISFKGNQLCDMIAADQRLLLDPIVSHWDGVKIVSCPYCLGRFRYDMAISHRKHIKTCAQQYAVEGDLRKCSCGKVKRIAQQCSVTPPRKR